MKFRYYENNKRKVDDITKVQKVLSLGYKGKSVIVDSKLLPLIEEAENGDFLAKAELAEIFYKGENVEKNYEIANYYSEQILDEACEIEYGVTIVVETRKNKALLESIFGNYSESAKWYIDTIIFQQEKVPVEDWDFTIYSSLEKVLAKLKTDEIS